MATVLNEYEFNHSSSIPMLFPRGVSVTKSTHLPDRAAAAVQELLNLPPEQRLEISRTLAESVASDAVDQAWSAQIAERIRQIEAGEVEGIDGDEVFREIEERLGERL